MKNKFQRVRELVNSKEIGSLITRKELITYVEEGLVGFSFSKEHTVDHYRVALTKLGYLVHISDGVYRVEKHIEKTVTTLSLQRDAYPNKKNRWQ